MEYTRNAESSLGACVAANKVSGVCAALIMDSFSTHQGVEDDDMNIMCLGGQIIGYSLSLELVIIFFECPFQRGRTIHTSSYKSCGTGKRS